MNNRNNNRQGAVQAAPRRNNNQNIQPQPQAPQVQAPIIAIESVFSKGLHASSLSESYKFGPEAKSQLKQLFAFSDQPTRFKVDGTEKHPHAYAAWLRKHADNAIVRGACSGMLICDIGGHAIRTSRSNRVIDGVLQPWYHTVHSVLPIIPDPEHKDFVRHQSWHHKLHAMGLKHPTDPFLNSCGAASDGNGIQCNCPLPVPALGFWRDQTLKSVDSAYYSHVADSIFKQITRSGKMAYLAFHDYASAYHKGVSSFNTFDQEASVSFGLTPDRIVCVNSAVEGNPHVYQHGVIATGRDSWYYQPDDNRYSILCQVVLRLPASEHHDYIVVECTALPQMIPSTAAAYRRVHKHWVIHGVEGEINDVPARNDWTVSLNRNLSDSQTMATKWFNSIIKYVNTDDLQLRHGVEEDGLLNIRIYHRKGKQFAYQHEYRGIDLEYLALAYNEMIGKTDVSASDRAVKLVLAKMTIKKLPNMFQAHQVVNLASYLVSLHSLDRYELFHHDSTNVAARNARNKTLMTYWDRLDKHLRDRITIYSVFSLIAAGLLGISFLTWRFLLFIMGLGVRAANGYSEDQIDLEYWQVLLGYTGMLMAYLCLKKVKYLITSSSRRLWLNSTCVTDHSRLDMNQGKYIKPKWKFNDPDWNVSHCKTGTEVYHYLGCDKCDDVGAGQICPMICGTKMRTPTVKHSCKRTKMAAAIRTTTNNLLPDDDTSEEWFRLVWKPLVFELIKGIKKVGGITVDIEEWKTKYNGSYQQLIDQSVNDPTFRTSADTGYDMFPKIELNYTTVDPEFRDTELNTIKERAIQAPQMKRRVAANAFVNVLEGIAHQFIPEYCGRCNWEQICKKIDPFNVPGRTFFASDGSAFDNTQTASFLEAGVYLFEQVLDTGLVSLDVNISKECIMQAILDSLTVKVNVDRGAVKYETEIRASGDGWTTFLNTMLMLSYWRYVFLCAEVRKPFFLVKGDDVLANVRFDERSRVENAVAVLMATSNPTALTKFGIGQITKKIDWGTIEEVDFLSNYFFQTQTGIRMTRIPDRVIQTTPWSTKLKPHMRHHGKLAAELAYSKGMCLLAWASDLPIWGALGRKLVSLGRAGPHTEYNEYADAPRVWEHAHESHHGDYVAWLDMKFSISEYEILEIEMLIQDIKTLEDVLVIPALDKFLPQ